MLQRIQSHHATVRQPAGRPRPGAPGAEYADAGSVAAAAELAGAAAGREYYWSLIDPADPHDPLRKLALARYGRGDSARRRGIAADDAGHGLPTTLGRWGDTMALRLPDRTSGEREAVARDRTRFADVRTVSDAELDRIASSPDIGSVLVCGEDSLELPAPALGRLLERLVSIGHVSAIILESQLPVYHPSRIFMDDELLKTLESHASISCRIRLATQFHHPREVTPEARLAFETLRHAGVTVVNHTPLLRGVNDNAGTLTELLDRLAQAGVATPCFYMPHPESGARGYALPLAQAYRLTEEAKARAGGEGRQVRLTLAFATGKLEVLAFSQGKAYLKEMHSGERADDGFVVRECGETSPWPEWPVVSADGRASDRDPLPGLIAAAPESAATAESGGSAEAEEDWLDLKRRPHPVPLRIIGD